MTCGTCGENYSTSARAMREHANSEAHHAALGHPGQSALVAFMLRPVETVRVSILAD